MELKNNFTVAGWNGSVAPGSRLARQIPLMSVVTFEDVSAEPQPIDQLDQAHFWLGIDGGGTNCRAVIVDGAGDVIGEGEPMPQTTFA